MQFRLLGPVEAVADDGRPLVSGTGKLTALLALLLLHPDEMVPAARLIDDLWGQDAPRTAAKSLQTYISQLRRALGDDVIETRPGGYLLAARQHSLDSTQFELGVRSAAAAAERGEPAAAAAELRRVLALWRGPALGGLALEPWAHPDAERLEEARLQALQARIEADLAAGRHRDVVGELEQITTRYPVHEQFLALLMLALYRCGRQADALAVCRAARHRMADELGIDVTPELTAMELRILRHDPGLASPPRYRALAFIPRAGIRTWITGAVVLAAAVTLAVAATAGPGRQLADANALVTIGADGSPVTQFPVGAAPAHVATGAGFLWASNELDGTVSRVSTNDRTIQVIPVGPSPQGMAFSAGDMWVAIGGSATIAAIDPRAGKVVRLVRVGNGPVSVTARGDEIWVANSIDGTVSTVDPGSGRAIRTVPVGPDPTAVVATDDAIWVSLAGSGTVAELDAAGRQVISTVSVGNDPSALAVAGGGVWTANTQDDTVSRISTATGTVDTLIPLPGPPTSVAVGSGTVWVTLADGRLARIDALTRRLIGVSAVGASPAAVAVQGPNAWVTTLPAPGSHRGGTLRVMAQASSFSPCGCLDPAVTFQGDESWLLDLVYNGLLAYRRVSGPAGGTLVGDLARAVPRPADGGRTYVFQLRRGVRFSNGQLVRAGDVAASLSRLLRLSRLNLPPIYSLIVGARSCRPGGCDLSAGIVADNRAGTITLHLTSANPDFLYALALPFAAVVPASSTQAIAHRPLPGTGPYQIAAYVPGHKLVLTRNPRFRVFSPEGTPDGYPDRIIATLGVALPAQLAAVERGTADVVSNWQLPPAQVSTIARRYAAQFHADSYGATDYFFLNTTVTPFSSLDARRAVNEAVDRGHLVQLSGGPGVAQPTCQLLPPDFPGYYPYCPYGLQPSAAGAWTGPDLVEARRLVAASRTKGEPVTVWAPTFVAAQATYVTQVLRQLGYRATVHLVDNQNFQYYPDIGSPRTRAQIGWTAWIRDYTSAADFIDPLFSCAAAHAPTSQFNNFSRFCDPRLERLISIAQNLQVQDPVAARLAWAATDRMIVDQAAAFPYANPLAVTLVSRRARDYQFNPEWGVLLDQLWVR